VGSWSRQQLEQADTNNYDSNIIAFKGIQCILSLVHKESSKARAKMKSSKLKKGIVLDVEKFIEENQFTIKTQYKLSIYATLLADYS
jgi:hypothetical protein